MRKKFGVGSTSLALFILTILWSADIKNFCLGDAVLSFVNLPTWSNGTLGTHYTIYYSVVFLIPAIIIGHKFPDYIFAKSGKVLSIIWLAGLLLSPLFMMRNLT